jgi:hypothetical protein
VDADNTTEALYWLAFARWARYMLVAGCAAFENPL